MQCPVLLTLVDLSAQVERIARSSVHHRRDSLDGVGISGNDLDQLRSGGSVRTAEHRGGEILGSSLRRGLAIGSWCSAHDLMQRWLYSHMSAAW